MNQIDVLIEERTENRSFTHTHTTPSQIKGTTLFKFENCTFFVSYDNYCKSSG